MSSAAILVVDDEDGIRTTIHEILSDEGYDVRTAANGAEAKASYASATPDLVLLDIWMPDIDGITLLKQWRESGELLCPVVIMSGHGNIETAVEATRLGAVDYIEKPLSLSQLLRTVEVTLEEAQPPTNLSSVAAGLASGIVAPQGKSALIAEARDQAEQIALHTAPVLVTGEAGSGRALFARYMHAKSARASRPFIAVNGAELNDSHAADLLIGIETSQGTKEGLFGQALGGTLFINELQELGATAQALVLNLVEHGGYTRLGQTSAEPADIRVIAAVNTYTGDNMRADLLATLAVLQLKVPPLRKYHADVPALLRFYVGQITESDSLTYRTFSMAAQNRLRNYPWPGNLRELENLVRRLLLVGGDQEVGLAEIDKQLDTKIDSGEPLLKQNLLDLPMREAREQFERVYLQQQLALVGGKVGQMAKRVGMERTHLYRKLRALGINFRGTDSDD
jgi:two-component system nitrogen regulation response regulator NtrX